MAKRDLSKLDLAFVLDCTGSMGSYIQNAKTNMNKIYAEIIKAEKCHLRIGLVNYRDHPPQDLTFVTQTNDLTDDIEKAKKFIDNATASGGGDGPEAVCCGLYECLNGLTWRDESVKIAILIADAPPHGLGNCGDGFPGGCPTKNDPVEIVHKMAEKGITLYCAACEPALQPYRQFFMALTLITGGQYLPLYNADNLVNLIIGGAHEEVSMEKLMAKVHNEVMQEALEKGTKVDEEELTKRIHDLVNSKNSAAAATADGDKVSNKDLIGTLKITDEAKQLSKIKTLKEMTEYAIKNKILITSYSDPASKWTGTGGSIFSSFSPTFAPGGVFTLGKSRARKPRIAKPKVTKPKKTSIKITITKSTRSRTRTTKKRTTSAVKRLTKKVIQKVRRSLRFMNKPSVNKFGTIFIDIDQPDSDEPTETEEEKSVEKPKLTKRKSDEISKKSDEVTGSEETSKSKKLIKTKSEDEPKDEPEKRTTRATKRKFSEISKDDHHVKGASSEEEESEDETSAKTKPKNKVDDKSVENISEDFARRLAKRAISRNKLSK